MATTAVHLQQSYASLFQAKEANLEDLFRFIIFLKGQFTLEVGFDVLRSIQD
jgi:hypothetical protein